jgi:hypothetical protein
MVTLVIRERMAVVAFGSRWQGTCLCPGAVRAARSRTLIRIAGWGRRGKACHGVSLIAVATST